MPKRNSIKREHEQPIITLRRSPRFFRRNISDQVDPKSPNSDSNRIPIPCFSSAKEFSSEKTPKSRPVEVSKKLNESDGIFSQQNSGLRRSARLNRFVGDSGFGRIPMSEISNPNPQSSRKGFTGKLEKRVTRRNSNQISEETRDGECSGLLDKGGLTIKCLEGKMRSSSRRNTAKNLKEDGYGTVNGLKKSGNDKCDGFNGSASRLDRSVADCIFERNPLSEVTNSNPQISNSGQLEKRVTRSCSARKSDQISEETCHGGPSRVSGKGSLSVKSLERKTRSSCRRNAAENLKKNGDGTRDGLEKSGNNKWNGNSKCSSDDLLDGGVLSIVEKPTLVLGLASPSAHKLEWKTRSSFQMSSAATMGGGEAPEKVVWRKQKQTGIKRKINEVNRPNVICQGWTKEQELALERAYFSVKPTPRFWKKVAAQVPGKSAKDCFDKVHSENLTPLQHQPRSRAKGLTSLPLELTPSKLLDPSGSKSKKPRHNKLKSHIAQRTVRHMLEKQCQANQDSGLDLFSVLEPTLSPSTHALQKHSIFSTPDRNQEKAELLKRCQERSSSVHRMPHSRFSSSHGKALMSPPVLKQIKNKALHEKYIDQLHCREAKRKAAFAKVEKIHQDKGIKKESAVQRQDAIKAAKNALFSGARDAIDQFKHLHDNATRNCCDDDDGDFDNDEDEGEDIF